MRASSLVSRLAIAVILSTSGLAACAAPSDGSPDGTDEVGASEDAIRSRALGNVAAVRTTRTTAGVVTTHFVALPDKVLGILEATGAKATRLLEGAPRCMSRNPPLVIEYLDARGIALGEARFTCDAAPGEPPGPTPGALRIGTKSFILSAYLNEVDDINARPTVLGDSIYGITRVVATKSNHEVVVTNKWDVEAALEAIGIDHQAPTPPPQFLPSCVADNTVTFYRDAHKVATVNVLCTLDERPAANAKLRVEGGPSGMILVDSEHLRDALGLQ